MATAPSSEAEMVALFLRAELPAARSRDDVRVLLERVGVPERVVAENRARLRLLTCHRGYGTRTELFDGFPGDIRWQWMAITQAVLVRVRYIGYDWSYPARSRPLMIRHTTSDLRMRTVRY